MKVLQSYILTWGLHGGQASAVPPVRKVQPVGKDAPPRFMGEKMKLTKEELNELFVYDESSPTCLLWKEGNEYGTSGVAGRLSQSNKDTPFIYIYGQRVSTALIVWVMHGLTLHPQKALAPRDGNIANVRIKNLQEVTLYPYTL